ncbi:ABC transporter permease [Gephyromycinifex aptenodytis]|uniref:ABC transporter permease n=1 Tax=Gephyromycinifex aptenodytis TaxID=2716227 RepID=UPI0014481547|nr:FtsX-like permease family protein [Gephyromycinifex aptenodytis]
MFAYPRRLLATALAIVLGVAFVTAALALGATLSATIEEQAAGTIGDAAVVVTRSQNSDSPQISVPYLESLKAQPRVAQVRATQSTLLVQDLGGRTSMLRGRSVPAGAQLSRGRLPAGPGEVAIDQVLAEARSANVGATITLASPGASARALVVGIVEPSSSEPASGFPTLYAADSDLWAWSGNEGYDEALLSAVPHTTPQELLTQLESLPGSGDYILRTGEQEKAERVSQTDAGTGVIVGLMLGFAAVSVLVSAIVIANTFSILLAQRVRELALLRCVGASRRQVFGSVLREAMLLAVIASVIGLGLGLGIVAGLSALSKGTSMELAGLSLDPVTLLAPPLVGVLVTGVAAFAPARRATRVAPLAAMRPLSTPSSTTTTGRLRILIGLALALAGTAGLVAASRDPNLPLGLATGAISVVGVLMLAVVLVPAMARLLTPVAARLGGLPGQLAVDNSRRNPARAAATASALFVGVTLITLMSVGAASGQESVARQLDRRAPVDVVLTSNQASLPASAAEVVAALPPVAAAVPVTQGSATIVLPGGQETLSLVGVGPTAHLAYRDQKTLAGVSDRSIILDPQFGAAEGSTVAVQSRSGAPIRLRVLHGKKGMAVVSTGTLARLDPSASTTVWAKLRPEADPTRAIEQIREALAAHPGLEVDGGALQRAALNAQVRIVLYVVTGLLAVAVLIALVGVGNTLSLSVLERTRENGLLRALGMTRRQVRSMLGIEAVALAGIGTLLGIALGIGYGLAGAYALLGAEVQIVPQVPWTRLGLVASVAIAAAWLASVLPGRRAAAVSPGAALASE